MTCMDYACLGRYEDVDWYGGLHSESNFRSFLASAVNLDSLHLYFSTDHGGLNDDRLIDRHWLHEVLRGQHWPKLKHFHLFKAEVDHNELIKLMRAHKQSLTAVVLCSVLCPHASGVVEMLHFMREALSLKRCDLTDFDFFEDDIPGELALGEICQEYKSSMSNYAEPHGGSEIEDDSESSDDLDLDDIDLGLWVLRRDTQGRFVDDGQALRGYREDDNSEEDFV